MKYSVLAPARISRYTNVMHAFFSNRYVQLALLTLGLGTLFFLIIWLIFSLIGLNDAPMSLVAVASYLGAGVLVAKFFAGRIF